MQHGLFCLILKFKPDQENPGEPIDIAQAILKTAMPAKSPISRLCKNIRSSDGVTYGELELPKAASLVFPILDKKPDARKRKMFTRGKNFVDDYYDKRSRARYVSEVFCRRYLGFGVKWLTLPSFFTVGASIPKVLTHCQPNSSFYFPL